MTRTANVQKVHVKRLRPGGDLLEEVSGFLEETGVRFGMVSIIGAFGRATLGSYDFDAGEYNAFEVPHVVEILHCTGNVSLLEGRPFAHLHAIVAGHDGAAIGGHVFAGCEIRVAECVLLAFDGEPPSREIDPETGLKLWKAE